MSWVPPADFDDDDPFDKYDGVIYDRAGTRSNRPRSKQRPKYPDALSGMVITVDRGRYQVVLGAGSTAQSEFSGRQITATRSSALRKQSLVVGDQVDLVGDFSGADGTLSRVVNIHERSTLLRRSADDTDQVERIVVANAEQLLIVVAAENPTPRPRLIDRYLVGAFDAKIQPILYITKTDLADPAPLIAEFDCLDLQIVTGTKDEPPLAELLALLEGKITVAVGHSGVGKSTLVNALVPGTDRATGVVNQVTGRGRHTSSSSYALQLPDKNGWIIDTPGVRSFGLGHIDPANVIKTFASHAIDSPTPEGEVPLAEAHDWEIIERIKAGELGVSGQHRIDSFVTILENLGAKPD
ncbi:MAG: ribosome small subunit-dependent GTPase A [Microbacteriaceae bacterium]